MFVVSQGEGIKVISCQGLLGIRLAGLDFVPKSSKESKPIS